MEIALPLPSSRLRDCSRVERDPRMTINLLPDPIGTNGRAAGGGLQGGSAWRCRIGASAR